MTSSEADREKAKAIALWLSCTDFEITEGVCRTLIEKIFQAFTEIRAEERKRIIEECAKVAENYYRTERVSYSSGIAAQTITPDKVGIAKEIRRLGE